MISDIDITNSIRLDKSFTLFFYGNVLYDGRASSVLENGNYLIIKKSDGCIQIHGATKTNPLNYMSSGTEFSTIGNKLICKRKKESIEISIYHIHDIVYTDLSNNSIKLVRSEAQLVDKLCNNITNYITLDEPFEIIREYKTSYGPIDVLVKCGDTYHVIEVKRNTVSTHAGVQVRKYGEYFEQPILYVAGPSIGKPAAEYASKHGITYIQIDFD